MCSVSHSAKSSPQIPPKSLRFPALSHTYCSVAYLVKPANIRSLLQGPFYPPTHFMSVLKFAITPSLLLSPLPGCLSITVTTSFLPLFALFLSFLLPHGDWMLNYINSAMSSLLLCLALSSCLCTDAIKTNSCTFIVQGAWNEPPLFYPPISPRFQLSHWLTRPRRVTSWNANLGTPKQTSWSTSVSSAWPTVK